MSAGNRHPFEVLRDLVLDAERHAIEDLQNRLTTQEDLAQRSEARLPDRVLEIVRRDPRVAQSLASRTADAIAAELESNPERFASLLIPVVLPAIRKAVFAQLRDYLRSLERVVEQTLTLQSLRWNIIAWRTGVSAHEVALQRSALASVEELLLVHMESGLMLGHVGLVQRPDRDPDLVSSMLSAVQSFVRESFTEGEDSAELDRLEFGSHELWIARGRYTSLAAAVRGFGDQRLRQRLYEAVGRIERGHLRALEEFDGGDGLRSNTEQVLVEYLQDRPSENRGWGLWLVAVGLLVAIVGAGLWTSQASDRRTGLEGWAQGLQSVPGLVILSTRWEGSVLHIEGLRDPMVSVPEPPRVEGLKVLTHFRRYASAEPEVALRRVERWAGAPEGARLKLAGATLVVTGTASASWLSAVRKGAPAIPGIGAVDISQAVDRDSVALQAALAALANASVDFRVGARRPTSTDAASPVRDAVRRTEALAARVGRQVTLRVVGTADPLGTERENLRLSRARSRYLMGELEDLPLQHVRLVPEARMSKERSAYVAVGSDAVSPWVSND